MDVGLILAIKTLAHRPEPLTKVYEDFLDDAVYGEQLGFDFAWTSEHHFEDDAWSPSQMPILANLAARTSHLRLGTNVLLLPLHHPLRIAEDIATVDILSDGRLDLCVGSGSIAEEFETFGIDPDTRWGRLKESLNLIRRSYEEDQFDHAGKYWTFPNVRMTTRPVQDPFPLWVGGNGPKLMRWAGQNGYHAQGMPGPVYDAYVEGLRESGHQPEEFNLQFFASVHLAPTRDQAWDEAQEGVWSWHNEYRKRNWIAMTHGGREVPPLAPMEELRNDPMFFFGAGVESPEGFMAKMEPMLKNSNVTHFGVAMRPGGGMDTKVVRRSMDTFAKELLPEIRTWGRDPVGSSRTVRP